MQKQLFAGLMGLVCMLALTACVTETTGGFFKKPTQQDLENALLIYVKMAYQQLEAKEYDQAMRSLSQALEIDGKSSAANTALAVAYQYQSEHEKADKTFREVIARDKKYTEAHLRYGAFLYEQKRLQDSCRQFELATQDDFYEKRSTAFFNLGSCYLSQDKFELAEQAFKRGLGLEPDHYEVLIELADLGFRRQAFPDSKRHFDEYKSRTRQAGNVLSPRALWLGIQLERVFDNKDAEASLALILKNTYPYSAEYLEYKKSLTP